MRILHITAGAANMVCGSCLRDNALAAELMRQGHDVTLIPIYTPTLTDEPNVSHDRIFFGGISVYLEQHASVFRRTPWFLDRLWDSRIVLKLAAKRSIPIQPESLGKLTVSMLRGEKGFQEKEFEKFLHWSRNQLFPDIVNLPNSLLIGLAEPIRRTLQRPICCTLQGEDLFLEGLGEPYRTTALDLIRSHVKSVDAFVAVSERYADMMSRRLRIPDDKIHVVPLGINLAGYQPRRRSTAKRPRIGFLARIAPEKGLHLLCQSYRRLRRDMDYPESRLEAAGYLGPEHKTYLHSIERQMQSWGLADEFHYRGRLSRREKIEFLQSLDVFSAPATYDEPKGMSLLEAMSVGVPVVQPRRGSFTEMVGKTRGGLLVDPDDPDSLARGIHSVLTDPALAANLSDRGVEGVRQHYTIERMAGRLLEVYHTLRIGTGME